jgi:hypothetical protein
VLPTVRSGKHLFACTRLEKEKRRRQCPALFCRNCDRSKSASYPISCSKNIR